MAADVDTSARLEAAGARVVELRGALWRRHTDLRNIEPADARYPETVTALLELTAQLLAAEAESTSLAGSVRRKAALAMYCLGAALIVASVALVGTLPGLGGGVFRAVDGAVLVIVGLVAMTLRRHRQPRDDTAHPDRRTASSSAGLTAAFEPETSPLSVFGTAGS